MLARQNEWTDYCFFALAHCFSRRTSYAEGVVNHSTGLCTLKWRYIALRTVEPWHEPLELQTVDELALSPNPSSSQPLSLKERVSIGLDFFFPLNPQNTKDFAAVLLQVAGSWDFDRPHCDGHPESCGTDLG